jgi:hypothetical protein
MSSLYWTGSAQAVAQIDVFSVAGATAADVDALTIKDEYANTLATISYTVPASPTNAAVATAIAAAWNASAIAAAIATASATSANVVLTATSAGVPQYVTSAVTGTGTLAKSSPGSNGAVANSGPSDLNTLANYSTGAKPSAGDTMRVDARAKAPILYGLNQIGTTLANLYIDASNSQLVGSAAVPWQVNATNVVIGESQASSSTGARRINLDLGAVQTSVSVLAGATASYDNGLEPIRVKGANAGNILSVSSGLVGVATSLPADAANFPSVTVNGGQVNLSAGCSTFTLVNSGGSVNINGPSTSVTTSKTGSTSFYGTAVATAVVAVGGVTYPASRPASGAAITTLTLAGGIVDFTKDNRPTTVGSLVLGGGAVKQSSPSQVTFSSLSSPFSGTQFTSLSLQVQ